MVQRKQRTVYLREEDYQALMEKAKENHRTIAETLHLLINGETE